MTINCAGKLIDLSIPKIMGILNITPDSFYDGGRYNSDKKILDHVEKMIIDGAIFIDIGAYSSRPGGVDIDENEELKRIIPAIELVNKKFPEIIISIDTFRSKVAEACLNSGASIINDISASQLDEKMMETIAKYNVPYIIMHMKGNPSNMQENTSYNYEETNKKFTSVDIYNLGNNYEFIQIHYKTNDKNYEIYSIDGIFSWDKLPEDCNAKRLKINNQISSIFTNLKYEEALNSDMSSERGFMDLNEYYFSNGDFIQVTCYKYKNKYISDYTNHGRLGIIRKELDDWIVSIK